MALTRVSGTTFKSQITFNQAATAGGTVTDKWAIGVDGPQNNTNDFFIYSSSYGNAVVINGSGNVGINTSSPTYPLHVVGTSYLNGAVTVGGTLSVTGASTLSGGGTLNGTFSGTPTFSGGITSSGNVIINTSSEPSLVINTPTSQANFAVATAAGGNYSQQANANDAVLRVALQNGVTQPSPAPNLFLTNQSGGNINFTTGTATNNDAIRMQINNSGQVSIGTARPKNSPYNGYTLSVYGSIVGTTAYILDPTLGTNWGDYVFDEDYKLTPLKEIETYVKKNHHLPEVPSKQEVIEKGVNLGEMDMVLLKKVEELTLHMIEMEKKDEKMQKEIEALKKENDTLKNLSK